MHSAIDRVMIERLRRARDPMRPRPVRPRPIDVVLAPALVSCASASNPTTHDILGLSENDSRDFGKVRAGINRCTWMSSQRSRVP